MRDAIGYVRVSTEEHADSGLGIEAQRHRIATFYPTGASLPAWMAKALYRSGDGGGFTPRSRAY
jgi:DNA invertase Pin-like site-specific DNA recombinase